MRISTVEKDRVSLPQIPRRALRATRTVLAAQKARAGTGHRLALLCEGEHAKIGLAAAS